MGVLTNSLVARTNKRNPQDLDLTTLRRSKVLIFDIETAPAHLEMDVYQLKQYSNYLHHSNVVRPGQMISFGAQWLHEPRTVIYTDLHDPSMLDLLWSLIDEADYVIGFNSDSFDLKRIRGYFAIAGMKPPSPVKSIDLMKTIRTFGFESSSLDYSCRMFHTEHQKLVDIGAGGWEEVMAGDPEARRMMRRYCTHDVRATTDLYLAILPWIKNHPIMNFDSESLSCPRCGSLDFTDNGTVQTTSIKYESHRCSSCSGLFRSSIYSRAGAGKPVL